MAKATTTKSVMLSVRMPNMLHERIMAQCDKDVATVGATVIGLLERGLSMGLRSDATPLLHRQIDELNAVGDAMREAIAKKDARIAELEATIVHGGGLSSGSLRDDLVVPKGKKGARPTMAIDTSVHHPSGPVLKSAVPKRVRGDVEPNFKPGQRAAQDVLGQAPSKGKGKR